MNYGKFALASLIMLALGASVGYYFAPVKTVEKIRVVEKQVEKRDVKTETTTHPDGSTTTVVTDNTVITTDKDSASSRETFKEKKDWLVSASVLSKLNGAKTFSGGIQRRVIGDLYVGVTGSSDGAAGVGFSFRF